MLQGKLVRLRPLEEDDLERYLSWVNDPEVTRYLESRYLVSRGQKERFLRRAATRTRPPDITLAIETLPEGRHIGSIALHDISAEDRKATLGIMIGDKQHWDRGYGTDSILTLLRYGFEELNLPRVDLSVDEDNQRGIACYLKCGFVEEGRLRRHRFRGGRYHDTVVMAVLVEDFYERFGGPAG